MAALSNYLRNKIVDWLVRRQPYTPPDTLYVALFTSPPDANGGGVEVSGGGYARVAVPSNLVNWSGTQGNGTTAASSGTSGTTTNNQAVTFPAPTGYWNTVTHMVVFDAPTGGNPLWRAQLASSLTVLAGDPAPSFPATTLVFQLDD